VRVYDENVSDEDAATLEVRNCYDAGFNVTPMEISLCNGDKLAFEIAVKNTGELRDKYALEYLGGQMLFELFPGESKFVSDKIVADYPWDSSNKVSFLLKSSNGILAEKDMTVGIPKKERCYSADLSIANGNKTKEKKTSVDVCNSVTVELVISNKGIRSDEYKIVVDGPDWAHISKSSFRLEPMEGESFYIYLSPPYEAQEKDYNIKVLASSENSLSGVEIDANVFRKQGDTGAGLTRNETGNETQAQPSQQPLAGVTGLFTAFEGIKGIPLEALGLVLLAAFTVIILLMRFLVFK
jgi:hypothetical protein